MVDNAPDVRLALAFTGLALAVGSASAAIVAAGSMGIDEDDR